MAHFAKAFSKLGVECIGLDHRGFGKSDGQRGRIFTVDDLINDSLAVVKIIDELYDKNIPRFFLG